MPILYQKLIAIFMVAVGILNATSFFLVYSSPWFVSKRGALIWAVVSAIIMLIGAIWLANLY